MFHEHLDAGNALTVYEICKPGTTIDGGSIDDGPGSALPVATMLGEGSVGNSLNGVEFGWFEVGVGEWVGDAGNVDKPVENQ
jgi:hypothetical protein